VKQVSLYDGPLYADSIIHRTSAAVKPGTASSTCGISNAATIQQWLLT